MSTGAPIYLVSACVTGEEFVAAFRRYADKSGLFVPMAEPLPSGRKGHFAVTLRDGGIMVEGEAEIVSSAKTPSVLHGRAGMTIRFVDPDDITKTVLVELEKARLAMKPPAPSVAPRPAELPPEPRPVPPQPSGRIDASNALAECVAIGDVNRLVVVEPPAQKPGPKFVVPTIPPVGGPRTGVTSAPPFPARTQAPSVPPIPGPARLTGSTPTVPAPKPTEGSDAKPDIAAQQPNAAKPDAASVGAAKPDAATSVAQPDAAKPDAARSVARPDAAKPDAAKPDAATPAAAKPAAASTAAAKLDAASPAAAKPDATKLDIVAKLGQAKLDLAARLEAAGRSEAAGDLLRDIPPSGPMSTTIAIALPAATKSATESEHAESEHAESNAPAGAPTDPQFPTTKPTQPTAVVPPPNRDSAPGTSETMPAIRQPGLEVKSRITSTQPAAVPPPPTRSPSDDEDNDEPIEPPPPSSDGRLVAVRQSETIDIDVHPSLITSEGAAQPAAAERVAKRPAFINVETVQHQLPLRPPAKTAPRIANAETEGRFDLEATANAGLLDDAKQASLPATDSTLDSTSATKSSESAGDPALDEAALLAAELDIPSELPRMFGDDVEIAEPTEMTAIPIDPETHRKTTIGVAVVPEGVTVLPGKPMFAPSDEHHDTSLMEAQSPSAGIVGPRGVDGRAPTIPPSANLIAGFVVDEPTPSGDWTISTGTGQPKIERLQRPRPTDAAGPSKRSEQAAPPEPSKASAQGSPAEGASAPAHAPAPDNVPSRRDPLPTGDWTIALDSDSPDGWSEPSKVEKREPLPGPPVSTVASEVPIESKSDPEPPAEASGPKVQIDPTLIEPLQPLPAGLDDSFTPMPAGSNSVLPQAMPPDSMNPGAMPPGMMPGAMPTGPHAIGMSPGGMPPGGMPPGAMPFAGAMPPGAMPGGMPPGDMGAMPPGAMPLGAMPPSAMPPGAMPGQMPTGQVPPSGFMTPPPHTGPFAPQSTNPAMHPIDSRGSSPAMQPPSDAERARKRRILVIALSAVLVLAIGVGAVIMLTADDKGATPTPAPTSGSMVPSACTDDRADAGRERRARRAHGPCKPRSETLARTRAMNAGPGSGLSLTYAVSRST